MSHTGMAEAGAGERASDDDFFAAFEFAFPVYEMAKLRHKALHDRSDPAWTGLDVYWHQETLATADDRWVTTPNIDTLYSVAWVDLAQGPVRLTIPPSEGRYVNLALLDVYTNNFACLSQRDVGSGGADLLLVGPTWPGPLPADQKVIRAPFDDVMLFARTLVDDDADLPAARRVQHGFRAAALAAHEPEAMTPALMRSDDAGRDFVALVAAALCRNPPPPYESDHLALLERVGLSGSASAQQIERWSALLPGFLARIRESARSVNVPIDQWTYSARNLGDFGTSYRLRALTALRGLLALPASEAVYLGTEFDADDRALHGENLYCLDLPDEGVPADAFWSLTLYEKMPSGASFLAHNPLNRYAFTDRNSTLRVVDGRIPVWVSHRRPPAALESNWLPAPPAPFRLALRAYHPHPDLLAGRFRMKPVVKMESFES
ncbi:MAG: DUF1254 domain-containing protein [Burkholderiaceae bacterium]